MLNKLEQLTEQRLVIKANLNATLKFGSQQLLEEWNSFYRENPKILDIFSILFYQENGNTTSSIKLSWLK